MKKRGKKQKRIDIQESETKVISRLLENFIPANFARNSINQSGLSDKF